MDYQKITETITAWLAEKTREAGADGLVLGISGGIDSAVAAALSARACPGRVLGLILPCHSCRGDEEDARLVAQTVGIPAQTVLLDPVYDALLAAAGSPEGIPDPAMARANLRPRLRMTLLYFEAARRNALVVGTGNKSELVIGYFTKYGDGGVDLEPLGDLLKTDVRALSAHLGLPDRLREKAPSAGLWDGQTDEEEMGFSYEVLDSYIRDGTAPEPVRERIEALRRKNRHKKEMPPVCRLGFSYFAD